MMYINKRLWSDVMSWQVTNIDEANGTATAVAVEKRIKPKMIPGGFAAHCPNLSQEFDKAEPVVCDGAEPFQITRNKDGIWGRKTEVVLAIVPAESINIPVEQFLKNNPTAELIGNDIIWFDRTKTGKRKTTFHKMGKIENECRYFYDYNF